MPMSIIIVGIGVSEFPSMVELDGDHSIVRDAKGRPCARDIV